MSSPGGESDFGDMFAEPEGFRPPSPPARTKASWVVPTALRPWIVDSPVPTSVTEYTAAHTDGASDKDGAVPAAAVVPLDLVGFSPLWGHHLWNASAIVSEYLLTYARELLSTPTGAACVLELGAAAGLPSIVAARYGPYASAAESASGNSVAKINPPHVVATDYPDPPLISCLKDNLAVNGVLTPEPDTIGPFGSAEAQGYIWGTDPSFLLDAISDVAPTTSGRRRRFDLILLSDLVFNHQAHDAMLRTCEMCLAKAGPPPAEPDEGDSNPQCVRSIPYPPASIEKEYFLAPRSVGRPNPVPCVLVFYTHHRPHLSDEDLKFFSRARQRGWECHVVAHRDVPPMFPEDAGDEKVRRTVWGWRMVWKGASASASAPAPAP